MIDTASILLSCLLLVYVAYRATKLDADERRHGTVPAQERTAKDVRPNRMRSERARYN
jgi:hypothetical protein